MNGGVIELSERTLVVSEPCYGGAVRERIQLELHQEEIGEEY